MEKSTAISISNYMNVYSHSPYGVYELTSIESVNGSLQNFHQWSNGKPLITGYKITRMGESGYYFLFIDWHRNDNYYLVIYSDNKSTTLAEIQQLIEHDGQPCLHWKYNPLKRDGKNAERKAYFKQVFGSTTIVIPLPTSSNNVERFIDYIFKLCSQRLKADRIVDKYQF